MLENVATRDWEAEFKKGERLKAQDSIPILDYLQMMETLQGIIDEKDEIIQTLKDKG